MVYISLKALTAGLIAALVVLAGFSGYAQLNLSNLQTKYSSLSRTHTQLMSKYGELKANHSILIKKYKELQVSYEELLSKYRWLEANYTALTAQHKALISSYQGLNGTASKLRAWLVGNISEFTALVNQYKKEVNDLSSKNMELKKELSNYELWLEENITHYEGVISNLSNELSSYGKYVNEVNTYAALDAVNQSSRDAFLKEALTSVSNLSEAFGTTDLIPNVFRWVLTNTYSQRDPYIPTYYWGLLASIWKLPNQTVDNEGGDCEDLALLTYAILKDKGVKVWLLEWLNGTNPGHAGVVAKYGGSWYVIDPAGEWLNGNTLYLRMDVKDNSGKSWTIWLSMLDLTPYEKYWLIHNDLAKIMWYDLIKDDEVSNPVLPRYGSLQEVLTAWLNYWGHGFTGYKLIDVGLLKEFSTLNDLINYLQTHT